MKKRILLFLLNRFGKKKENCDNGGKTVAGIGCLSAFFMGPFLAIFLFFAVIVWIATSLFACTAQAFYLLYMDRVTARVSYLSDLAYCFSDGVKLRTMQRVKERFGIELTDEDMDVILTYARDTRIPTVNYRNYKNAADLAKFAKWTTEHWKNYPNTSGDILTVERIYLDDNPELWMILGQRTADNTGIYKGYLWLNQKTGDIELTEGNTQKVKRYSTGVEILKQAEETYPMEDIEWVRCPGLGVINETTGVIGILTEEGVITANEDGLKEREFKEREWTKAFLFPEVDYSESIQILDCTIHARGYQ